MCVFTLMTVLYPTAKNLFVFPAVKIIIKTTSPRWLLGSLIYKSECMPLSQNVKHSKWRKKLKYGAKTWLFVPFLTIFSHLVFVWSSLLCFPFPVLAFLWVNNTFFFYWKSSSVFSCHVLSSLWFTSESLPSLSFPFTSYPPPSSLFSSVCLPSNLLSFSWASCPPFPSFPTFLPSLDLLSSSLPSHLFFSPTRVEGLIATRLCLAGPWRHLLSPGATS